MKLINLRLHLGIFLLLSVLACNDSTEQLKTLTDKNNELRDSIKLLKIANPDYLFESKVVARNTHIKLGEEYIAETFLLAFEHDNPYKVIFCNINNGDLIRTTGTLPYHYPVSIYKTTPKDTGTFQWGGIVLRKNGDQIREYPFLVEYHVTK